MVALKELPDLYKWSGNSYKILDNIDIKSCKTDDNAMKKGTEVVILMNYLTDNKQVWVRVPIFGLGSGIQPFATHMESISARCWRHCSRCQDPR